MRAYHGKQLVGGGALGLHQRSVEEFGHARSPREKMVAVDWLIHAFHWELVRNPGRSVARELIYANNTTEHLTFLDQHSYGERSRLSLRERKAEWDAKHDRSAWHRLTGFGPERGTADATTENKEGPGKSTESKEGLVTRGKGAISHPG
jgi:hypothetical protein